jgi:hypothetical protein
MRYYKAKGYAYFCKTKFRFRLQSQIFFNSAQNMIIIVDGAHGWSWVDAFLSHWIFLLL